MNRIVQTFERGALAGALVLLLAGAAEAQVHYSTTPPPRSTNNAFGQPGLNAQLPQRIMSRGESLLRQDFQFSRSPGVNSGRFNRQPLPNTGSGIRAYPGYGGYGYGGYYPGYAAPIYGYPYYGGYYSPYAYGNPYGGNVVQQQREVIIIREGAQQPQQSQPQPQPQQQPQGQPGQDQQGFYLNDRTQGESLSDALDDIRKAWLNGDITRLEARFNPQAKVRVYPNGAYKYSVGGADFVQVIRNAMTQMDTVAFEFDRPRSEANGRVLVTGKHTFIDSGKQKQQAYVSYGLERQGGKWKIVEAGSSGSPIQKHQD